MVYRKEVPGGRSALQPWHEMLIFPIVRLAKEEKFEIAVRSCKDI